MVLGIQFPFSVSDLIKSFRVTERKRTKNLKLKEERSIENTSNKMLIVAYEYMLDWISKFL